MRLLKENLTKTVYKSLLEDFNLPTDDDIEAEVEKYKTMLFDLYDKMNEKSENDKYWEIFQFLYKDDGVKDVHSKLDSVDTLGKIKKSLRRS